jgi:predicted dehydrogenase
MVSALKSVTAALVGCGRMGINHAESIRRLRIPLIAVADREIINCQRIINSVSGYAYPMVFGSLREILIQMTPELLVVSTTSDEHTPQALVAVRSGVPMVLVEKPVGISLAQCRQLSKACEKAGTRIAVNHQMRFLPQYVIPKELLQSDAFGGLCSMHVAAGNFGMAMNATHYFEAFRFLTDEPPDRVSAWFDSECLPNPRGAQFKDVSGCIRISTVSGHRLYLDASADQGHGVQVTYMARNGRITIDELTGDMTTVVRKPEHRDAPTTRYGMPVVIEQQQIPACELVESTKAVMQALISGENYPTLADATLAVKTLVAAYHSHRQGGIEVPLASIADDDPEVFPWA